MFSGAQQIDGSSTAAAPSVTALTHLAIVCEALLMESEHRKGAGIRCWFKFLYFSIFLPKDPIFKTYLSCRSPLL